MKDIYFAPIMPHPVPQFLPVYEVIQPVKPQGRMGEV